MTIQQTERAREDESTPLARMKIFAAETNDYTIRAEQIRPEIQALLEALTPPPSEEVVEAVARAICGRDLQDRDCDDACMAAGKCVGKLSKSIIGDARAAIAAMPSIPQESDAGVTEDVHRLVLAARDIRDRFPPKLGCSESDQFPVEASRVRALEDALRPFTAMTSARDRRG